MVLSAFSAVAEHWWLVGSRPQVPGSSLEESSLEEPSLKKPYFFSRKKVFFPQSVPYLYGRCVTLHLHLLNFQRFLPMCRGSIGWQTSRTLLTPSSLVQAFAWFRLLIKTGINWHAEPLWTQECICRRDPQSTWGLLILCGIKRVVKSP